MEKQCHTEMKQARLGGGGHTGLAEEVGCARVPLHGLCTCSGRAEFCSEHLALTLSLLLAAVLLAVARLSSILPLSCAH